MLQLGHATYAVYLLVFSVPLVAGQAWLLTRIERRAALPPALAVTAWLTFADHFAIADGIWRFDETRISGLHLGAVPIEEALFFLMTNLLVAFGVALFSRRA